MQHRKEDGHETDEDHADGRPAGGVYVAAKVAEGKLPDTWREIMGDRAAEITTELKIENHILYARIQSSVLRSELFYQREALKEEINRRSGVRLVNAVIIR